MLRHGHIVASRLTVGAGRAAPPNHAIKQTLPTMAWQLIAHRYAAKLPLFAMSYLAWKLIHIASVIIFLGNITTGLFWAAHAHKTRDFRLIASTFEGIIRSDRWFTLPGVIGILIGGFAAAIDGSLPILATGWILWPIILFTISGVVFGVWVAPLQGKIVGFVRAADASEQAWQGYEAMYKRWERWGLVALITPAIAVVIMVLKPSLPGL